MRILVLLLLLGGCSSTIEQKIVKVPEIVIETKYEKCLIDAELFRMIEVELKDNLTYLELNKELIKTIKKYEARLHIINSSECVVKD
tara:strand:+ start:246 stop:506 length:261 start_codon:yes stop_codon:yes gene_type:complete